MYFPLISVVLTIFSVLMEPMLATKSWTDTFVALPAKKAEKNYEPLCYLAHIWQVSKGHKKSRWCAKVLFNEKNFQGPQSKSSYVYVHEERRRRLDPIHFSHFFPSL